MKGSLAAVMATWGERGNNDAILIDDDDNGKSASELGSNDTNIADSKKDLSFIIARSEARGAP